MSEEGVEVIGKRTMKKFIFNEEDFEIREKFNRKSIKVM